MTGGNGAAPHTEATEFNVWQQQQSTNAEPFVYVLARDIQLTRKAFLIAGLVGIGETSAWYGPPDCGKSCVVLDAACHVAAGADYCGRAVVQGAVLYVAVERGAVVKRRVLAWCYHHRQTDIPLGVVTEMVDLRTGQIDADRVITTAKAFEAETGLPIIWIIIDTLNRALAGGDENSSKDMGALINNVDRIQRGTGAHCSLIHHVPVDRTDRMRGHSSVLGAVDLTVRILKENKTVIVEADKANDLVDKPRLAFRFESVELTRDLESGEVTTAPVMMPAEAPTATTKLARLAPTAKAGLRHLHECIAEHGKDVSSNRIPAGAMGVTLTEWRDHLTKVGILNAEGNPREQFRRIRVTLINAGAIGIWEEIVWAVT